MLDSLQIGSDIALLRWGAAGDEVPAALMVLLVAGWSAGESTGEPPG